MTHRFQQAARARGWSISMRDTNLFVDSDGNYNRAIFVADGWQKLCESEGIVPNTVWVAVGVHQMESHRDPPLLYVGVGSTKEAAEAGVLAKLRDHWQQISDPDGEDDPFEPWLDNIRDEDGNLPEAYEEELRT